jgi:GDP-L-fucose synthase
MKILITGSSGFLGKNLLPKIKQQFNDRSIYAISSKEADLRDAKKCKDLMMDVNPDIVIHAAGSVGGIIANKENPGKFIYDNLIMGCNIIHSSMVFNVKKFILLGTVCSYPKFTQVPFCEKDLWLGYPEETNAPYGIAKKTLIEMLIAYNKQYGFNSTSLLPANMYGPHDHFNLTTSHVIPALIMKVNTAIQSGQESITIWGTGQVSREFLFVEDCAQAIINAVNVDTDPQPINIGTGQETKIIDLIEMICKIMNYTGEIIFDSTKPDGQPRRCLDTSLAKKQLNFEAKTSLNDGLSSTINWFLNKR